jgi:hypothetical protein
MQNMEEKYKIILNKQNSNMNNIKESIVANNFYCLTKPKEKSNRCICEDFFNIDENCTCTCGLYTKVARTEEEIIAYNSRFKYTTD